MATTAIFKLNKRCKSVDKYDEVDGDGKTVKEGGVSVLLGTVYVNKDVAKGRERLKITVED